MNDASPDASPDAVSDDGPDAPTTVAPMRTKTPLPVVIAALLLGAVVIASSVLAAVRGTPAPEKPPDVPTRFGPATFPRIDALRDRVVTGLMALRQPEGDFTIHGGAGVDPEERREATAMGILGLSIGKRMGSKVPGVSEAIVAARAVLIRPPKRGALPSGNRILKIKIIAATLLALSIGADPADVGRTKDLTAAFLATTDVGPPVQGWPQGVTARAFAQIIDSGRASELGDDPFAAIPIWDNTGSTRDGADQRVSEALAQAIKSGPAGMPSEIFAKVIEDPIEWNGERTDLARWTLRAWLAARVPGGDAWFVRALPALEAAVDPTGRIEGEMYGYPAARSAQVLLILWEGISRGGNDLRARRGP